LVQPQSVKKYFKHDFVLPKKPNCSRERMVFGVTNSVVIVGSIYARVSLGPDQVHYVYKSMHGGVP